MTRGWKIGLSVAAGIVALNLLLAGLRSLTGGTPGGPRSSSYATGPDGDAAYASLLLRTGHRVRRERKSPASASLSPEKDTAVVLDPPFVEPDDLTALTSFVADGGRLIASEGGGWLRAPLPTPKLGADGRTNEIPFVPIPELAGVRRVVTAGGRRWEDVGAALPSLGDAAGPLLVAASPGRGRVLLLSDSSPLQNRYLDEGDNARLALGLAGSPGRRVVFFESYHGYGRSSGLAAIPFRWKTALLIEAAAVLTFMLARARRLGPPEADSRELPPPRAEYVRSLAATLARTRDRGAALEPLRAEVQRALASGVRHELSREELEAALDGDELALGKAFARTRHGRRGRWTS